MSTSEDPPDRTLELLRRWRAGDRVALNELLEAVLPWLLDDVRAATGRGRHGLQESMDLVQGTVLSFLEWGPKFEPQSTGQLRMLLRRITRNQLVDLHRRAQHAGPHLESLLGGSQWCAPELSVAASRDAPDRAAAAHEEQGWLHLALQFLDPLERTLLLESEVEGQEWATIAARHQLPNSDAARMRVARLKPRVANLIRKLRRGQLPAEDGPAPTAPESNHEPR